MANQEATGAVDGESAAATTTETTAVTVLPATSAATPVSQPEYSFRAYDHGFTNGLLRIEAEDFEVFAEESEKLRFIRHQLYLVESETEELRETKATVTNERLRLTQERLEAEARQKTLQLQLQRAQEKRQQNQSAQAAIDAEKATLKPPYAWPPAILYLLAGFVFISADIAVMHDITVTGLNLAGEYEPWLFAVGLAFISFLIKPAVDRILEKPYERNENVKRNHTVLVVFATLALFTLGVMGYFRSEATSIQNQKDSLATTLIEVQQERVSASDDGENVDELSNKERGLEEQIKGLESKRAESTSMQISLILAAIIFAIAGAVCLGIAFPAINKLHRSQFVLRNRRQQLMLGGAPLESDVTALEAQLAQEQQKQQLLQFTFGELVEIQFLVNALRELRVKELELRQELVVCQAARHRSLYRDGKARGEIYQLQGTLSYSVTDADRRVADSHSLEGSTQFSPAAAEEDARRTGKRPYVVLRRLISKHYTRHRQSEQAETIEIE